MNGMSVSRTLPFISLQQVCRQYSAQSDGLKPTDLNLYAEDRVGLVGCSGAGKSTLLKLLLALEAADAGHIHCQGAAVRPAPAHRLRWYRRLVQYVPQDAHASLNPRHTVAELIIALCGNLLLLRIWVSPPNGHCDRLSWRNVCFTCAQGSFPAGRHNGWRWRGLLRCNLVF